MTEKKLVPELRFPGFDEEWQKASLSNFSKVQGGYAFKSKNFKVSGIPIVRISNILENGRNIKAENLVYYSEITNEKNFVIRKGDLLIAMSGATTGKACLYDMNEKAYLNQRVGLFRIKSSKLSHSFLIQIVFSGIFKKSLEKLLVAGAQPNISGSDIESLVFKFPSLPEQQKIASFLSSVDERLRLLQQKQEKLERYKKGVMQKLFPKTGEKTPEIRFKDDEGKDFPEWEEKTLGEVYEFISTNSYSRNDLNYEKGTVLNIHYGDIHTKFKTHLRSASQLPFINGSINLDKVKEIQFCKSGDIIFADASEDYDDIGKAIEVVHLEEEKVLAGLHTIQARRITDNVAVGFSGHFLNSHHFRQQIMRIAQGTKVLGISQRRLADLFFFLPVKAEQQKIATFLSSIDRSIEKLETEITGTEKFKKGLLQKMFV